MKRRIIKKICDVTNNVLYYPQRKWLGIIWVDMTTYGYDSPIEVINLFGLNRKVKIVSKKQLFITGCG